MINPNTAYAIEQNNLEPLSKEDTELFKQTGVLIQNNVEEEKIYSYMHNREKYASTHLSATVLLTESCNLRCIYCFQGHNHPSWRLEKNERNSKIK